MQAPSYKHEFYSADSINDLLINLEDSFGISKDSIEKLQELHYKSINAFEYLVVGVGVENNLINTPLANHTTADAYSPIQKRFFVLIEKIENNIIKIINNTINPAFKFHTEEFKRLVRKRKRLYEHHLVKGLYKNITDKISEKVDLSLQEKEKKGKHKKKGSYQFKVPGIPGIITSTKNKEDFIKSLKGNKKKKVLKAIKKENKLKKKGNKKNKRWIKTLDQYLNND